MLIGVKLQSQGREAGGGRGAALSRAQLCDKFSNENENRISIWIYQQIENVRTLQQLAAFITHVYTVNPPPPPPSPLSINASNIWLICTTIEKHTEKKHKEFHTSHSKLYNALTTISILISISIELILNVNWMKSFDSIAQIALSAMSQLKCKFQ